MRNCLLFLLISVFIVAPAIGFVDANNTYVEMDQHYESITFEAANSTMESTFEEKYEEYISEATEETVEQNTETTVHDVDFVQEPIIIEEIESQTECVDQDPDMVSLGMFKLTAYCSCQECCGEYALNRPVDENGNEIVYGSIGVRLQAGVSIAVDPSVIPYGTEVVINGHTYIAQDTGGSINGNRIDVYFDDHYDALVFGVQNAEVLIYT